MCSTFAIRTAVAESTPSDLFFDRLSRSRDRALLLDYDGTIAPFSVYRHRAFPYPTIPELLDCIMSTCRTRVALVTGRTASELPPLLGLTPHPEIWGTYGIERLRPDGSYEVAKVGEEAQQALAEADVWLQHEGLDRQVEVKRGALAVHWRGLNPRQVEEAKTAAYRVLSLVATRAGLVMSEFDGGLEIRVRTHNKANAVRMALSGTGPDVPVAYLGDDTTDEDAFRALNGRGLTVLVRPTYRFTAAQTWIRPPEELIQFLTTWVQVCGGDM